MFRKCEKTWLLATLGALLSIITLIIIWQTDRRIVPWWGIACIALPWAGFDLVLRKKQDSLGAEGKYIDWWSVPHYVAGGLLGLFGIGLGFVAAIAIVWEVIEIYAHTREHAVNRVVDIVLAVAGWATAQLLADGGFPLV